MAKFQPGQSGNPGGRRPSLVATIQRKVGKDGQKLITELWALALGKSAVGGIHMNVDPKDRIAAMKLLLEFGFSKPVQEIAHSGALSLRHGDLDDEALDARLEQLQGQLEGSIH